jgi:hypothetical protein
LLALLAIITPIALCSRPDVVAGPSMSVFQKARSCAEAVGGLNAAPIIDEDRANTFAFEGNCTMRSCWLRSLLLASLTLCHFFTRLLQCGSASFGRAIFFSSPITMALCRRRCCSAIVNNKKGNCELLEIGGRRSLRSRGPSWSVVFLRRLKITASSTNSHTTALCLIEEERVYVIYDCNAIPSVRFLDATTAPAASSFDDGT